MANVAIVLVVFFTLRQRNLRARHGTLTYVIGCLFRSDSTGTTPYDNHGYRYLSSWTLPTPRGTLGYTSSFTLFPSIEATLLSVTASSSRVRLSSICSGGRVLPKDSRSPAMRNRSSRSSKFCERMSRMVVILWPPSSVRLYRRGGRQQHAVRLATRQLQRADWRLRLQERP